MNEIKEYVIIGEENFEIETIATGLNTISFVVTGMKITDAVEKFRDVTELSVSGADLQLYGIYTNLTFESATVYEDGAVGVTMHIKTSDELWKESVETSQAEQDEAIAAMMFGGEE